MELKAIKGIRSDLRQAEADDDYGDGDYGRFITAGNLWMISDGMSALERLLEIVEVAQATDLENGPMVDDGTRPAAVKLRNALADFEDEWGW